MLTTNQLRILIALVLLLAAALGGRAWLTAKPPGDKSAVAPAIEEARKLAAGRSQVVPLAASSLVDRWWPGFGYAAIEAEIPAQSEISGFFLGIHDPRPKALAVSVSATFGDGTPLPLVPLAILVEEGSGYRSRFAVDGRLTPFVPMGEAHQASLTLDIAYLNDVPDSLLNAAKAAIGAARGLRPGELRAASAVWREQLAARTGTSFTALLSPGLGAEMPAIRLALQGAGGLAVGGLQFKMVVAKPILVDPAVQGLPVLFDVLGSLGVGTDQVASLAVQAPAAMAETCRALMVRLTDDLGLGPVDRTIALWALVNRAAVFGAPGAAQSCFDEATTATLKNLALTVPNVPKLPPAEAKARAVAESMVLTLSPPSHDKGRARLDKLMAPVVLIEGSAALPASMSGARLVPAATQAESLDFLAGLPVVRASCAWRAEDAPRASLLVTMENDKTLYRLDAAFDEDGLLYGLRIGEAGPDDFCRALKRRPADGPCLFAGTRAKFRNVDPARCAKP